MVWWSRMAPRGQVTARNHLGRSRDDPVGPRLDPRALSCPIISFEPRTQRPLMVWWAQRPLGTQRTIGNTQGRSPDDPVVLRPDPRALSRSVISFEPRTRGWLTEAINALVGPEALEDPGDYRGNTQGRSPNDPVGPRSESRTLSRSVFSFEPRTRGWLVEAINVHERQDGAQRPGDSRKHWGEFARPPCGAQVQPPGHISPHNLILTSNAGMDRRGINGLVCPKVIDYTGGLYRKHLGEFA